MCVCVDGLLCFAFVFFVISFFCCVVMIDESVHVSVRVLVVGVVSTSKGKCLEALVGFDCFGSYEHGIF